MITKDEYIGTMRWAFIGLGSNAIVGALVVQFPFLGVPPLKQIVGLLVSTALKAVVQIPELGAFFLLTDFRVSAQGNEVFEAARRNYKANIDPNATDLEKANAKTDLHNKFRAFAKLTN